MGSPTSGLREVAAAWISGAANASAVVQAAVDLLLVVEDDSAVLPIAILPPDPNRDDLRAALEYVFEISDDTGSIRGARALELALRWQCGQYKAGALGGHDLIRWVDRKSHHGRPVAFEPFEFLDDYGMTESTFAATLEAAVDEYLARSEHDVSSASS